MSVFLRAFWATSSEKMLRMQHLSVDSRTLMHGRNCRPKTGDGESWRRRPSADPAAVPHLPSRRRAVAGDGRLQCRSVGGADRKLGGGGGQVAERGRTGLTWARQGAGRASPTAQCREAALDDQYDTTQRETGGRHATARPGTVQQALGPFKNRSTLYSKLDLIVRGGKAPGLELAASSGSAAAASPA